MREARGRGGKVLRSQVGEGAPVVEGVQAPTRQRQVCWASLSPLSTVSDLAYCSELEAMVTASRDSTVKVWEADWQIRMVFVGHSGPVTAVAVLPNTSLVLSASQDGTLRTWDLQAAAQVGEVALSCWDRSVPPESVSRLLAPAGPGWPLLSLRASSVELWRLRELYSPLAQLSAPVLHLQVVPVLPTLAPPAPQLPVRLVCACADGSVSLVSALTGRVVNALLLEPEDCAAAVAYCLQREVLWLLTRAGHLLCANSARCPMQVLHRLRPPPPPTPRPCCLHLYSHLTDPRSAFASWEIVCQHKGDLCHRDMAWAWKDKNRWVPQPARAGRGDRATQQTRVARRYLPVVGHTDGTLSVLELRSSKTVFRTEAHSPGPITAIASTWNSVVSSGPRLSFPTATWDPPSLPRGPTAAPAPRGRPDCEDVARLPLRRREPGSAAHLLLLPPGRGALCPGVACHRGL